MSPTCKRGLSLKKENYLSEFNTPNQKEFVRTNLGITDLINSLDKKIDAKVIAGEGVTWDLLPTEGNTEDILSSDAIYKALSLYVTILELESLESGLLKLVIESSNVLDEELNKAVDSLISKIHCLELNFAQYATQINSTIETIRNGGIFNVSLYLQLAQSLDSAAKVTLSQAVESTPTLAKNIGQIITFLDTENVWQQYQYQSDTIDDWNDLLKWQNLNEVSSTPIDNSTALIYNISDYIPGGDKYGQLISAGIYTIYGTTTPVSQYRVVFNWDSTLGDVPLPTQKDTSLIIKDLDNEAVDGYCYYVFVGNDDEGYGYQTSLSDEEEIPDWIETAFGNNNDLILANINQLKNWVNNNKIQKGTLKTIQGKSLEGTGNIEIDKYVNLIPNSQNGIDIYSGDGIVTTVNIDGVIGTKVSYDEDTYSGNAWSQISVPLIQNQHYLLSFYLDGSGTCDLSNSFLWDNVTASEFQSPVVIEGETYIDDTWKNHLIFNTPGYHYISFYSNQTTNTTIDFDLDTSNYLTIYKPLFVACSKASVISWFANDEDYRSDLNNKISACNAAFKGVTYNKNNKQIVFTCLNGSTKTLDATDFIKDGMVDSVITSEDGTKIIVRFNTDSGKEDITIDITELFDPVVIDTTNNIMKINKDGVTYYTTVSILAKPNTPIISTTNYAVVTGNVNVSITPVSGATIQYSLDEGNTWTTGTTITIASGFSNTAINTPKTQKVKVKAIKNGETSDIGTYTIIINPKVAPVNVSVTRNNNNNNWSTSATITFTASATTNATSMYSTDNGTTWTSFTGTHTETTTTSQSANKYQVKTNVPNTDYINTDVVKSSAITLNAKKFYYGNGNATLNNESDIKSLTGGGSAEKSTMAGTYNINKELNKYLWFCGSGTLTKITSGGFEVPVNSVVTVAGYNCYRISGVNAEAAVDIFVVS